MRNLASFANGALVASALLLATALVGCGNDTTVLEDLCTGAKCRGGCDSDKDCPAGRKCDPAGMTCVECLADADCPAAYLCRASSHACVPACNESHGCGDAGVCNLDAFVCVGCLSDNDCKDSKLPRCEGASGRCVACLPQSGNVKDNCPLMQYCADAGGVKSCKAGCKDALDCAGGGGDGGAPSRTQCDTTTHSCAECLADADCGPGKVCRGGSCGDGCNDQRPCANGLTCCDGRCADLAHDAANCKACGVSCGGGVCCAGGCVDPVGDPKNCGACGQVCTMQNGGAACVNSACAVGFCNAGFGDCNGSFADGCETSTDSNVNHCGSCNFACAVPNALPGCARGACTVATCLAPFADCNGKVVDGCEINTGSDVKNCGGCGRACSGSNVVQAACTAGRCTSACAPNFADCNGDKLADGCEINTATDVANCGACGNACSANHGMASCSGGACAIACAANFGDCDGDIKNGCENTLNSNNNCGGCGVLCSPAHAVGECTTRSCRIATCEAGWADCNNDPKDGCEVRTATDVTNCGVCAKSCNAQGGAPACNGGLCSIACNGGFADCNLSANDGCEINVATDINNCGVCGSACSGNHMNAVTCAAGACNGPCTIGFSDCNANKRFDGCETSTFTDVNNCGICGKVCVLSHATPRCAGGTCLISVCESGYADCDLDPANGCEVAIGTDTKNCGACGRVCNATNGTPSCAFGSCSIACAGGFGDCNNSAADGCETNLTSTPSSCGACGRACSLPHATAGCAASACTIVSCDAGWLDCDSNAANGCETNVAADTQNCGACGKRCSIVNDTPTCVAGACQITCVGGYGDCNSDVNDGCEARLSTDTANCGACGVVCSPSHVAPNSCAGGVCNGICAAGFADCNGNKQIDGCEADIAGSTSNCGACGVKCSGNHVSNNSCVGGSCSGACTPGWADCDGNLQSNGCERGVSGDLNNCGGCGVVCSQNHIAPSCVNSACTGSCSPGYGDCNMNLQGDGCETSLLDNVNSCGMCGAKCSGANVVGSTCVLGICAGSCNAAFGDCDGDLRGNGCESELATDINNCGACGKPCSGANVVGSACTLGACTGVCKASFGDCDLNLQKNGCETDLLTDGNNCGQCGMVCGIGKVCTNGACK